MKKHKVVFDNEKLSDEEIARFMDFPKVSKVVKTRRLRNKALKISAVGIIVVIIVAIGIYCERTLMSTSESSANERTSKELFYEDSAPVANHKIQTHEKDSDQSVKQREILKINDKKNSSIIKGTSRKKITLSNDSTRERKSKTEELVSKKEELASKKEDENISVKKANLYEKAVPKHGFAHLFKYFSDSLIYPESAKRDSITGTVQVQFIVSETGTVENIKVLRGVSPELDEEAKRLTEQMPPWLPAQLNSTRAKSSFVIPINFQLGKRTTSRTPGSLKRFLQKG